MVANNPVPNPMVFQRLWESLEQKCFDDPTISPAAKARAKALFYAGGLAMFGAVFQACGLPNDLAETMVAYLGDEVGSLVHKDTTPA